MAYRRRADRGFTLIEVMMAVAILGIGVLTVSLFFVQAVDANRKSKHYTSMVTLVNDWTERFQGIDRNEAVAAFQSAWPGCGGVGTNFTVYVSPGSIDEPGDGISAGQATLVPTTLSKIALVREGPGVVVSYNVAAYCPPERRTGVGSATISNVYQIEGTAFLVKNVAAGIGNYDVVDRYKVKFIFADRAPLQ